MRKHIIQAIFLAFLISGCGILGFESDQAKDSLKFDLVLDKTVIAPGERFTATYTAKNRSDRTMRFVTSCTAFALSREIGQVGFDTVMVTPGDYTLRVHSNIAEMNGKAFSVEAKEVDFRIQ